MQIEFEGIKYTPVEDDNEVRNDDDDKVQEQHEQDEAELSWPTLSQKSLAASSRVHMASHVILTSREKHLIISLRTDSTPCELICHGRLPAEGGCDIT